MEYKNGQKHCKSVEDFVRKNGWYIPELHEKYVGEIEFVKVSS